MLEPISASRRTRFQDVFSSKKPIIGMIHLPPLPGTPAGKDARFSALVKFALSELDALQRGGVDGVIVENFWDLPYLPASVPAVTLAAMAAVAGAVVTSASIPVGVNILYNDYVSELALARAVGAAFIRAEVYIDPAYAETGLIPACAAQLQRERTALYAEDVAVLADVQGKNTQAMWPRPLGESAADAQNRGLADAVVVTGTGTGKSASIEDLRQVRASLEVPLLAGSGVTPHSVPQILSICDGAIVGSFFKRDGRIQAPVDSERVSALVQAARKAAR